MMTSKSKTARFGVGNGLFRRKERSAASHTNNDEEKAVGEDRDQTHQEPAQHRVNHAGHRVSDGIQPDGESGRSWFHPWHFFRICFRSSCTASKWTNILWPFTIAAFVLRYRYPEHELWIFITAYIGMVPAANLVGFGGQEFARKVPKVIGVITETTLGSIVEIVLFMVLLKRGGQAAVIRAAILGSILANLLFCLGCCFLVGGIFHPQQTFHEAISEVGSNLMLVAAVGLVLPAIYTSAVGSSGETQTNLQIQSDVLNISRAAAIVLLFAFVLYIIFQLKSHHSLFEEILEADEMRDRDRHRDLMKAKLTLFESVIAVTIALTFVTFMAIFLVEKIDYLVESRGVRDEFVGLILVPIVEKAAEHITAIDEAYDNQMNFALAHVIGASIQTALLNTPLVILVAWGLGDNTMSLDFKIFDAVVLILAIIIVGNFLRDEKSDYLEGALCVMVWILIAICAFYYRPSETDVIAKRSMIDSTGPGAAQATMQAVKLLLDSRVA